MPGRVTYVGPATGDVPGHEYTDGFSSWIVPADVPQAEVPAAYRQELEQGFDDFKQQTPDRLEALRQEYNDYAARTREHVDGNPRQTDRGMARGIARPQLPEAVPFDSLPQQRLLGPTEAGPSLSSRPGEYVQTDIALAPGSSQSDLEHEALHAAAYEAKPENYYQMGPREREQWRVYATEHATRDAGAAYSSPDKRHHTPHEAAEQEAYVRGKAERVEKFMTDLTKKLGL